MPNIIINAGPGCGKTTSITDAYLYYRSTQPEAWFQKFKPTDEQKDIYTWCRTNFPRKENGDCVKSIYMAYNNHIVESLKPRLHGDAEVKTHHGWGYKIIKDRFGYVPINEKRGEILVEKITGVPFHSDKKKFKWIATLRYIEKLKDELLPLSIESLMILQEKYSDLSIFPPHEEMLTQASQLLTAMKDVDRRIGVAYQDQVWLALFLLPKPLYQIGFIDECQDLSPARLMLSNLIAENKVFCGDENQAINAWNGADPESMNRIRKHCVQEFQLKTSFRLPPNIARLANSIRPTAKLISPPEKEEGKIQTIQFDDFVPWAKENLKHNPMIICRYNAPLLQIGLQAIQNEIPIRIVGSQMADSLIMIVKNRNAESMTDLYNKLAVYEQRCMTSGNKMTKAVTQDKFDAIRCILSYCQKPSDFPEIIKRLMNPNKETKCINLSSVHRAKGLESRVVMIIDPPVESDKAETPSQIIQEKNVAFVAVTRTLQDLYYMSL